MNELRWSGNQQYDLTFIKDVVSYINLYEESFSSYVAHIRVYGTAEICFFFNIITKRGHAKCEFLIFKLSAPYVECTANQTNRVIERVRWRIFSNSFALIIFLKSVRNMRVLYATLWSPIIHEETDFLKRDTARNFVKNTVLRTSEY